MNQPIQNSLQSPKLLSQRIRKHYYKTLMTSVIQTNRCDATRSFAKNNIHAYKLYFGLKIKTKTWVLLYVVAIRVSRSHCSFWDFYRPFSREGRDTGLLITTVLNVYKHSFLFVDSKIWVLLLYFDSLSWILNVSRRNFVYYQWARTSIYRSLSYPLISLTFSSTQRISYCPCVCPLRSPTSQG